MKKRYFTLLAVLILVPICNMASVTSADEVTSQDIEVTTVRVENDNSIELNQNPTSSLANVVDDTLSEVSPQDAPIQTISHSEISSTEEAKEISVEEYEDNIRGFKQISYTELTSILEPGGQDNLLYVGRPTCYYCRQNSPVLKAFNDLIGGQVLYYNTDADQMNRDERKVLFDKLGIPGTPSVVRLQNGNVVSGYLGSAPSAEDIYQAVFKEDDNTLYQQGVIEQSTVPQPEVEGQESSYLVTKKILEQQQVNSAEDHKNYHFSWTELSSVIQNLYREFRTLWRILF